MFRGERGGKDLNRKGGERSQEGKGRSSRPGWEGSQQGKGGNNLRKEKGEDLERL